MSEMEKTLSKEEKMAEIFPDKEEVEKLFPFQSICPEKDHSIEDKIANYLGLLTFLTYIHNNFGLEGEKENAFLINYCEVFGSILEGMMSAAAAKKAEWCEGHCPHKAFGQCPSGCTYRWYSYKGKPTPIEELSFDGLCQYFGNFFEKEIGPVIADIRQKRNATHLSKKQATLDAFVAKNLFQMSKRALLDSLLSSLNHYWEKQGAVCLSYPNEVKHG